jgi:hypothetical protein
MSQDNLSEQLRRLAAGDSPPPIDERLLPFQVPNCDITKMRDAVLLVQRDPSIQNVLIERGITPTEVDFNRDGNPQGNASNREWASALIAAAQLTYHQGRPISELSAADILREGSRVYADFQAKEARQAQRTGNNAVAPAQCEVTSGVTGSDSRPPRGGNHGR